MIDGKRIYDISPTLDEHIAVFPGDQVFSRQVNCDFSDGTHYLASAINTTVHVGAHADAPSHYLQGAASIDARDLSLYLGLCQVIHVTQTSQELRIMPEDIADTVITAPRVLFKTNTFANPQKWRDDFWGLSPELIKFLAQQNVRLVGIDTPSVDPANDKVLLSHNAIAKHDIAILEGLVLSDIAEGEYTLIALPLKIKNGDAAPVRAVLME